MQNFKQGKAKSKKITETIGLIEFHLQNSFHNFNEKSIMSEKNGSIFLQFPKGYFVVSVKLNKEETAVFKLRLNSVKKYIVFDEKKELKN